MISMPTLIPDPCIDLDALEKTVAELDARIREVSRMIRELHKYKVSIHAHPQEWGLPVEDLAEGAKQARPPFSPESWEALLEYCRKREDESAEHPWDFIYMFDHFADRITAKISDLKAKRDNLANAISNMRVALVERDKVNAWMSVVQRAVEEAEVAKLKEQIMEAQELMRTDDMTMTTRARRPWVAKMSMVEEEDQDSRCTCEEERKGGHKCGFIVEPPKVQRHPDGSTCHCWQFM
ncbi:hypothetical protein HYDPIDRAFT_25713 [Hydnomerulius pinastri MD-312]|nr:hypothetical protein HYDPIDRAFT_25713 [Hydnomerulius pinastri MD-312]